MKKRFFFVAAAALALLATACSKDNDEAAPQTEKHSIPITLTANYGNGSKVNYTDDGSGNVTAKWEEGDKIIVCYDGSTSELTLQSGGGTATATFSGDISCSAGHEPKATTMLVCYVKDANVTHSEVTVDGTGTYHYTDNVFKGQDGTLGGAAKLNLYYGAAFYGNGNITCNFSVNTSLMKFTLTNLSSDATNSATLSYMSNGTEMATATFTVTSGANTVWLSIPAGAYSGVQKLVYICGDNRKEHVLSADHANFVAGRTYSKSVSLYVTVPEGAISGLFSVSADKKVYFSKGNLQYQASGSGTWKFADNQYDYIGVAAGNTTAEADRATQADWIDLFRWGTSGNDHGAIAYQPYAISDNYAHYYAYGNSSLNLYDSDGTADWGSNTISNTTGNWRTLTSAEWVYLMTTRTSDNKVTHSYMKAKIDNTYNGIIIFPDGYDFGDNDATILTLIDNYSLQNNTIWSASTSWNSVAQISSSNWTTLQNAGCVFLPAAGSSFASNEVRSPGTFGAYWSSSAYDDINARYLDFSGTKVDPQFYGYRDYGHSVRLVKDY